MPRTRLILTVTLAAAFAASRALACPAQGKSWKDFSSFTLNVNGQGSTTITLLTDGLHAKSEIDGKRVEMLQLNDGPTLHLGHDPAKGPSPFMFFDMAIGAALKPIAEQFASPCAVPGAPVPFSRPAGQGYPALVRGTVRWLEGTTLAYELQMAQGAPDAPPMPLRGEIHFDARQPAPADMPLTGWIATRGGGPSRPDVLPPAATLRELRERTATSR